MINEETEDERFEFSIIHEVGNFGIFALLKFENKLGADVGDI